MRTRFCLKVVAALLSGAFLYQVTCGTSAVEDVVMGCRIAVVEGLGSPAQRERLLDDVSRLAAERTGTTAEAERSIAFRQAIESQRHLAATDPALASAAIEIAIGERKQAKGKRPQ